MSFIKAVMPLKDYRLFMNMQSGSSVIVDFSAKLDTMRYAELEDEAFFRTAATDGDYVVWDGGRLRLAVNELMDVILLG